MPPSTPLTREPLHSPLAIGVLLGLCAKAGVPRNDVLGGTGLDDRTLEDSNRSVTREQWLRVCRNAMHLSPDPALALRAGAAIHLADLGMLGLLLQSCANMAEHFRLAVRYQPLGAPSLPVDAVDSGSDMTWLVSAPPRDLPESLRTFLVEQQVARQSTQVQDALSAPCPPRLACFTHAPRAHEAMYRQHLGCPCIFNWHRNELRYPKDVLRLKPRHAHAPTAAMLQSNCDRLLSDLESSRTFAGRVHEALRELRDRGSGMQAVASALKMTDRTLRRRLADEGTSFTQICREFRLRLATERLTASDDSVEQIASLAGFSDPANFRRAFIRWTLMTPAQFRRSQHPRGGSAARMRASAMAANDVEISAHDLSHAHGAA